MGVSFRRPDEPTRADLSSGFEEPMSTLVQVSELKPLGNYRLWLRFSDGQEGIRDFSDVLSEGGPMVEPLRDPALFSRVFIEYGVPTWPNGFDVDAMALHMEMVAAGLLSRSDAA